MSVDLQREIHPPRDETLREAARQQQVSMWLRMIAAQPDDIRAMLGLGPRRAS